MINKQAFKLLKLLAEHEFLSGHTIKDYGIDTDVIDYLESLGLADHSGIEYSQIKITQTGRSYLTSRFINNWKFLLPLFISIIALLISIFKP